MLTIQLTECKTCGNLLDLLCEIDEKIKYYAVNASNNMTLMTCLDFNENNMKALLRYKEIVTKRLYNENYACHYPTPAIISRVKLLLYK